MKAVRGVLRVDLSPYVDENGWPTFGAYTQAWVDHDVTAFGRLVQVDVGGLRRVDERLVDALLEHLQGARGVEIVGTYAKTVDIIVSALSTEVGAA